MPDRIEFTNRLKGYTVTGVVLLALGSFLLACVFLQTVFDGLSARYWLLAAIPALGAGLLTWRWGAVIDRRAGIVTKWWGFLVPFFRRAHAIYEFEAATVTHEQRSVPDSEGGLDTYVVKLVKRSGATVAVGECPRLYELARRQAEKLAQFLNLPVREGPADSDRSGRPSMVLDGDRMVIGQRAGLGMMLVQLLCIGGGLLFVVVGIGELAAPEWLHRWLPLKPGEPWWVFALTIVFGLACISMGVWLSLSLKGDVLLDRRARTVTQRRGFPVAFRCTVRPLDQFKEVVITLEARGDVCYDVSLEGRTVKKVFLDTAPYRQGAEAKAKAVADFLGLPVRDETGRIQ